MRNLRTVAYHEYKVPKGLPLTATAWDTSRDGSAIICAFGPTPTQPQIELKCKTNADPEYTLIASWDAPCPLPELSADEIVLLQYFADTQTACLILAGGDIVIVREYPTPGQEKIEIVGSVDVGISAAAWAPDQELLAIVTRSDTLVLMSKDFEPVTETSLSSDDLKISKHVSVGWGKKETQFQGKRAKAMRDPTMPETVDEGKPSVQEDGEVSVSWRGDGAYFVVNSVVPDYRRVIRVFDREGKLDSASEPVDGLESALSWRPYGNLIAGIKRSTEKVEVIFLERNGLRHGEFDLRVSAGGTEKWASKITLTWNIDSTILAVSFLDRVQLWTMGNYHYYLKQEIRLTSSLPPRVIPVTLRWHPESPMRLGMANYESLLEATYVFAVSRGPVLPPHDLGTVAVIDGNTLKLTPLRQAGVPPPMSFCEFKASSNIIDCAISPNGDRIAILTATALDLCTWLMQPAPHNNGTKENSITSQRRYSTATERRSIALTSSRQYTQVKFRGDSEVFILAFNDGSSKVYSGRWSEDPDRPLLEEHQVGTGVQNIFADARNDSIWAADLMSMLMVTKDAANQTDLLPPVLGPATADTTIIRLPHTDHGGVNGYHKPEYHKVSLSSKATLSFNARVLARDCSSFIVTDAHLIFTTMEHLLKFVHLTMSAEMEVPDNTPETDERVRSIERGAKIVTVMPSAYAVVLQMPRGNLEAIYPRLLVLSGIRQHLDTVDYKTAFLACQQHQVDLNILHDYQPGAFFTNINKFIERLKKPSRVDEFLSKLKDEDVTKTLYRDTLNRPPAIDRQATVSLTPQASNKVNRICDAILSALASKSSTHLTTIITAQVCKRPPDLTAALTLVSNLHKSSPDQADSAVSHLCFLTDSNKLYNAALALYELEVTLLIAQHSQRDPREYMPFLQNLNSISELRRRYKIDDHLKNYSKALESLVALEAHEEAEIYCLKHSLYTSAIYFYKYSKPHLDKFTNLYATHLASTSQNLQAALLYDSLSDHHAAYPLYALAHHWREALTCASLIPLSDPALTNLATGLATTQIEEHRDYRAAAHIHLTYLSSPQTAATLLCKGSYFAEALLLLSQDFPSNNSTLVKEIVDPSLLSKFSEILSLISDCKSQLSSQIPRILDLRVKKAEDPLAFFGGDLGNNPEQGVDFADNISLAPTESTLANQSLFTRYNSSNSKFGGTVATNVSRKTSKTKRKEERKRARGKKGSVYEEEYPNQQRPPA